MMDICLKYHPFHYYAPAFTINVTRRVPMTMLTFFMGVGPSYRTPFPLKSASSHTLSDRKSCHLYMFTIAHRALKLLLFVRLILPSSGQSRSIHKEQHRMYSNFCHEGFSMFSILVLVKSSTFLFCFSSLGVTYD